MVFIVGGFINGSWADIWNGMKLVVFGVVDAIIRTVLELGGAVAGVADAIAGLFGSHTKLHAAPTAAPAAPQAPVVVQLQVDGQTLATVEHRADQDTAGRSFSPVPSY